MSSAASLPLSAAFFSRFIPGHSAADTIVKTRRLVNGTPRSGTRAPAMPPGIAGGITRRGDVIHAECALRSIVAIVRRQSTGGCVEPSPTAVEKSNKQTRRYHCLVALTFKSCKQTSCRHTSTTHRDYHGVATSAFPRRFRSSREQRSRARAISSAQVAAARTPRLVGPARSANFVQ